MIKRSLFISLMLCQIFACQKSDAPTPNIETPTTPSVPVTETGNFSTDMLKAVNNLRAAGCRCGSQQMPPVSPLKWNSKLEAAAKRHASDMATKGFFSHKGSDGSTMQTRIEAAGYSWSSIGENIARGYSTLDAVIKGWITSEGHCRQMMDAGVTELGAAENKGFWVQDFGKPR